MSNIAVNSIIICIFLCFSAFFSGMEAAIFSISRFRLKTLLFEKQRGARVLERLKGAPSKTLATILLANLLVNVGASSVGAIILLQLIHRYGFDTTLAFTVEFILMTSVILIFGEIAPKTIAISNAEFLALRFGKYIEYLSWIFAPVSRCMEGVMQRLLGPRMDRSPDTVSDKEIKLMLSEAKRFKVLDEGEEEFGFQILKFGKMTVSQIMTPRQKVAGIEVTSSFDQAKKVVTEQKHSRICVFDEKGEVVGILYAKDLFIDRIGRKPAKENIREMMRELYVVPETKLIDNLLLEFRKKGIHISIVVDEFGNFTGIVTLEDILESLFGEIIDEYDDIADLPYKKVGAGAYLFEGDVNIGELARVLQIEPFAAEGERLSGYILSHFGKIPSEKEKIQLAAVELTIEEVHDRIIEKVLVRKL
ncbi:MAG: HlyC/CorC family transporter [candidate division WOR-3 bacterium]|nr:MAG: HlyC/CorC family transporter [candidate division WOR-3 bacterium]